MTARIGEHRSVIDNCPPRRHLLLPTAWATAAAVAGAALLGACGGTAPLPPARGADANHVVQAAGSRAASVCLDGTSSSAWPYAVRMRGLVADAIAGWASQQTAGPTMAMPAHPSLDFVLRSVTTVSYSTDVPSLEGTIPAVSALAAQPRADTDPSFAPDIHVWTRAKTTWKQSAAMASAAALQLSGRVRQFPIVRHTWSAIYSCIAAAAAQLAPAHGSSTRLAVFSDMINNRQVTGLRLDGDAVLIVGICPAQASAGCTQRFAAARTYLLRHGASSVAIVRADAVTPAALDSFWRGS